jgi:hypothetical protein
MLQECQQALKVYLGSLVEDAYYLNDHKKGLSALVHVSMVLSLVILFSTDGLFSSWSDFRAFCSALFPTSKLDGRLRMVRVFVHASRMSASSQSLPRFGLSLSTLTFAVALLADITSSRRLFLVKNILSTCRY